MGKLSDLWEQLRTCPDHKRIELEKKINSIETWMIDNNFGSIKDITDWSKKSVGSARPLDPPIGARYGKDKCLSCVYNRAGYCDINDEWVHQMKV